MVKLQTRPLLQRTRLRRVRLEAGTLPPRPRNFRITIFMSRTQQTLMLKPHYMSFAECENARLLTEPCRMAPACRGTVARLQEVFESRNTIHSLLMICPTDPPQKTKKSEKSRKKFQAKAIQGHVPWLTLKKNFQNSFLQYASNVGTPLFRSMRQTQNIDTHALSQLGASQNSSPL